MALYAGSVTVDSEGAATGDGLAFDIFDKILDGVDSDDKAAIASSMVTFCEGSAEAIVSQEAAGVLTIDGTETAVGATGLYVGQIVTTDTGVTSILEVAMPLGVVYFEVFVTAITDGGNYLGASYKYLYRVTTGALTLIALCDYDSGDTITGTVSISTSGQTWRARASHNVADGTTTWTATLKLLHHSDP